ncbi:hypothetical protein BDP55DRAFT_624116 [Colletotrichum godetiae]|uniref:Uncharacterized protein n=1 Tax=Colletotrichum godetiae TaxID=1209918 RepID=A0AAJ0EQ25_9PEZI|nr:uncharacterized protein BDP55DRAFT_624116 [Colletotrichum godetiae]KAK1657169.1 hypothetical protein BDP55DRAFT_624116 [Colletotrichum godetiae]
MDSTATSTTIDVSAYDQQLQCPLFGTLPGEIRNEIFALALVQYEEEGESAYAKDSYWYRPGFTGPRKSSSSLLRACKLAYAEGQKVFLRELEWAFWFDRGPKGRTRNAACTGFFSSLTEQQSRDLTRVRFFTQMYWLEGGRNLATLFAQPRFAPEVLTITVRYSDWWYWESDEPLRMSEDWLRGFRGPRGLRELRVEYETLVGKREEMMGIVGRNKGWKLVVEKKEEEEEEEEEGYLSAEGTELVEWTWKGPSKLGGQEWAHHGEGETVEYVVVMDTWRFVEGRMSEEDRARRVESQPLSDSYGHFWHFDDSDRSSESWSEDEDEEGDDEDEEGGDENSDEDGDQNGEDEKGYDHDVVGAGEDGSPVGGSELDLSAGTVFQDVWSKMQG